MFIHFQFSKNSTPPPTESLLPLELLSTSVCGLKTEICHADTISVSSVLVHPISDWPTAGAKSAGAEALGGELTGTLGAATKVGAGGPGEGRSWSLHTSWQLQMRAAGRCRRRASPVGSPAGPLILWG